MSTNDLLGLLEERAQAGTGPVLARTRGSIVFNAGPEGAWTLLLNRGSVTLHHGPIDEPTSTISASLPVLRSVIEGIRSGVEAFLDGELSMRGSMALALQMDGLFAAEERPDQFPRAGLTLAAGIRTAYLEAGPKDAPPVVLIHGLGATNGSMLTTLWDLARDHRVIAPDLPGHGATEAVDDCYDAAFLGRWLSAFFDAVGAERPVLIGNSLGGRTALEAGLEYPDKVGGLVLLAPAVAFRKLRQFVPLVRKLNPQWASLPVPMTRKMAEMELRHMFAVPERISLAAYDAAVDEFVRVWKRRSSRVAFFCALRSIYLDEAFGEKGFWDRLPTLQTPALFIWGGRDRLVPHGFARHVSEALPHSETVVFPDCGHVPQFELPDETHAHVRDFLRRVERARPVAGAHPVLAKMGA
ncbi:MAG TPA: alpha/beta fold hydrolase [Frankiaceae bacterium]|nr:alpha/beta fold hydrolase [Frankiaceae bacterium]